MRAEPAPVWDPGNNTIWKEYVDITFVVANSLVLLLTSAVGIVANIFVILAVYNQKSLQTSNNALVVNLAAADILRCVLDCPVLFAVVLTVHHRGHGNLWVCDAQVVSFSFSCCVQLLTLACLSGERHQAIAFPFKTSQRKKRIQVLIPLTWILALVLAVCCLTFVKDSPVHIKCKGLVRNPSGSYDTFGLYMLLPLWVACFSVIIGFYARIFALVRAHNRKIFDQGVQIPKKKPEPEAKPQQEKAAVVEKGDGAESQAPPVAQVELLTPTEQTPSMTHDVLQTTVMAAHVLPGSENEKDSKNLVITDLEKEQPCPTSQVAAQTEENLLETEQSEPRPTGTEASQSNGGAAGSVKCLTAEPQEVLSNVNTDTKEKKVKTIQTPTEKTETVPHVPSSALSEDPKSSLLQPKTEKAADATGGENMAAAPTVSDKPPGTEAQNPNVGIEGAVCVMPSKASKERANKKKESKMAKRAGYIILTFLLFWLPLITTILINFVVHKNKNSQVGGYVGGERLHCVNDLKSMLRYF